MAHCMVHCMAHCMAQFVDGRCVSPAAPSPRADPHGGPAPLARGGPPPSTAAAARPARPPGCGKLQNRRYRPGLIAAL
eukprot:scaffold89861_cov75-Phaeocystis_antarctica.AAC.3